MFRIVLIRHGAYVCYLHCTVWDRHGPGPSVTKGQGPLALTTNSCTSIWLTIDVNRNYDDIVAQSVKSSTDFKVRRLDGRGHCLFEDMPAQGLRVATAVVFVPHDRPNVCFPKFGPLSVACRVRLLHRVKIWTLLAELRFP